LAILPLVRITRVEDDGAMTIALAPVLRPATRPLTDEELAELHALTAHLPQLLTGWSTPVVIDPEIRVDAAMWELACRHGIAVGPDAHVLDVVDGLARNGWSTGPARDALRAFVMLRWGRRDVDPLAAGRLLSYLELRSRFG
jgi:hypothetical protein